MKRFLLITCAVVYVFFILICFAANAQQSAATGPLMHIHTVKDFRGKVSTKDTTYRMDTARMNETGMHKRPHHSGKDSSMMADHQMMRQHHGNGQAWAGHRGGHKRNIDSIAINRKITIRSDSMIRDTRRIVYFKPSPGKNYKSADTVLQYNVTVHKGMKPSVPDITNNDQLNDIGTGSGNTGGDIGTLDITDLNIYPNPSNGQFKVTFTLPDNAPVGLKITDMEGKTIWKDASTNFSGRYDNNIDLSTQPKAVYILEIMQNNKTMLKKLVMN
jgi:hypothetical protein